MGSVIVPEHKGYNECDVNRFWRELLKEANRSVAKRDQAIRRRQWVSNPTLKPTKQDDADESPEDQLIREFVRCVIKEQSVGLCGDRALDLQDALATAQLAHMGQTRRSGGPYLSHPMEVARIINVYYPNAPDLCTIALLHDALEDALTQGNVSSQEEMESMIAGSFQDSRLGHRALEIVSALTHDKGIPYTDYLLKLASEPSALKIKLADMLHNIQSSPSERQFKKYQDAIGALKDYFGGTPPQIDVGHWNALLQAADLL